MHATYHIRFAAICILGLIYVTLCLATEMTSCLCADNAIPCVLSHRETQRVCTGESVYSNITLRVPTNVSPEAVTILILGHQFSKGTDVSGPHHFGDNECNRWINRISYQGDTMTYEIWNSNVQLKDEFEHVIELNIEGDKETSDLFKWFDVSECTSTPTLKPPSLWDTYLDFKKMLDQMNATLSALASDMAEVKKMKPELQSDMKDTADNITNTILGSTESSYQSLKSMLDYLKNIGLCNIIMQSFLKVLGTIAIMFFIWFMSPYQRGNKKRSASSRNTEVIESGSTPERAGSLLSLAPQDETAETDDL